MAGVTPDIGAPIAVERGDRRMQALLDEAHLAGAELTIPAGVLAQAWRGVPRQARISRLRALSNVVVSALDEPTAKAAGVLCGRSGTADVIEASVVIVARLGNQAVITSDPGDLGYLDPTCRLLVI